MREAEQVRMLAIDPHSPAEFRCNQVVRNLDGFHEAFGVEPAMHCGWTRRTGCASGSWSD